MKYIKLFEDFINENKIYAVKDTPFTIRHVGNEISGRLKWAIGSEDKKVLDQYLEIEDQLWSTKTEAEEAAKDWWKDNHKKFESFINEAEDSYSDYPKAASANAKKALDWRDKYGRDEVDAGTAVGWQRANQLAKGEAVSRDIVARMASFNRHRKNSTIDPEFKDTPWKDRGVVAWALWGGDEGVDWAMKKMEQIKKEEE